MMISLYLSLICTFAPTKWQWDSSSNPYEPYDPIWTDYYPLDNDAIEKGFQDGLGKVPLSIGSYHVDLAHMKQRSNDLQRNRRVRRVEVGHHPKSIHVAKERVANEGRERDLQYFELICGKHMPYANDERLRKCAEEMLNEFISSGQLPFRFTSLLNGEWLMTDPKSNANFTYVWKAQSDIQVNKGHNKFKFVGKQTHHNGDLLDEPFTVYGYVEKPAQKIMWIVNGVQCEGRINFDGTITDGTYQKSSDDLNVQSQNEFFGRKLSEENSSSRKNNNTSTNARDDQSLPQQFYLGDKDDLVFQNDLRAPKANDHKDPLYDWYNETEKKTKTIKFRPGTLGIIADWSKGDITEIEQNSQAEIRGVKKGWKLIMVNGIKYDSEWILDQLIGGEESYLITFNTNPNKYTLSCDECIEEYILARKAMVQNTSG